VKLPEHFRHGVVFPGEPFCTVHDALAIAETFVAKEERLSVPGEWRRNTNLTCAAPENYVTVCFPGPLLFVTPF
jgi:hypothetical protein